jgi:Raf kinase inhibitor-like YbhB/YbcL family protein
VSRAFSHWVTAIVAVAALASAPVTLTAQARAPMRVMSLSSSAFEDGGLMPTRQAQAGRDVSPPLMWRGAPDSTKSFVLVVHDVDAAVGDGTDDLLHWLVWSIPSTSTSLPEGVAAGAQLPNGLRQVSVSGPYYRGPAAPASGPPHHYVFELFALDVAVNQAPAALPPALTRAAIMRAISGHVLAKAVLVGRYQRPQP